MMKPMTWIAATLLVASLWTPAIAEAREPAEENALFEIVVGTSLGLAFGVIVGLESASSYLEANEPPSELEAVPVFLFPMIGNAVAGGWVGSVYATDHHVRNGFRALLGATVGGLAGVAVWGLSGANVDSGIWMLGGGITAGIIGAIPFFEGEEPVVVPGLDGFVRVSGRY